MKKIMALFLAIMLLFITAGCNLETAAQNDAIAEQYIQDFAAQKFDKMYKEYAYEKTIASMISEEILQQSYTQIFAQEPAPQPKLETKERVAFYDSYLYSFSLKDYSVKLQILINANAQIASFVITEYTETNPPPLPENVSEKDITIGTAYPLDGKVTYRADMQKQPAVILVAGSGANDMNETLYANKPFRDIAYALAKEGITVVRYNKRTYQYPKKFSTQNCTIQEEVLEDVTQSIAYVQTLEFVDKEKIYIVGHSLGAYLTPMMLDENESLCGAVMLNTPYDALEDILLMQVNYLAGLDNEITTQEQEQIDILNIGYENVKTLTKENQNTFSANELMGFSGAYWLSLREAKPAQRLKAQNKPVLMVGCEEDYQVPISQLQSYQNALDDKDNITFKRLKNLNHMLMDQGGTMTPDEYTKKASVDHSVTDAITSFILSNENPL